MNNKLLCPFCGEIYAKRASLSKHLNKYKLQPLEKEKLILYICYGETYINNLVNDYIQEKYCVYELPIDITKYLTLLGIKRTSKEERQTERYKEKYKNSIFSIYGVDNISKSDIIKNKKKITELSKYETYEQYVSDIKSRLKTGLDKYFFSDRHIADIKKFKNTNFEKYGVYNVSQNADIRQKISNTKKEYFATLTYEQKLKITEKARSKVTSRGGYSSKPEKRIQNIISKMGLSIECNKMLFGYNWDIVFNNFLIEMHGTYWHCKPTLYSADFLLLNKKLASEIWDKDAKKVKAAIDNNYRVIIIWEDELKSKSDEEVKNLIQMRFNENGYYFI